MDENPNIFPLSSEQARVELTDTLHRSPTTFGLERSRWWLNGLRQVVSWLANYTVTGIWQVLHRFGLRYKRGRAVVYSPDPDYDLKLLYIHTAHQLARQDPERYVLLYEDELTYYRRPTVARAYTQEGQHQIRAEQGYGTNSTRRIASVLDTASGRVIAWQRKRFNRQTLIRFYGAVEAAYPNAATIFIAQDNWPVHFHPDVLLALANSKIILLRLPTYAPWTNPHEKVWLKLYQEVLHQHRLATDWIALQQWVERWLQQFQSGSLELLRFVGLLPI